MRLHHLDIQAFGPFGDRVSVDFDLLAESGVFLFTGKTGAGKSSVLDAVCFALYGVVPGTRHAARQLRSDHAEPHVAPEVTLEFSVEARRFRIRRSPAWQRPKRRGTGMTTQPASVVLEESHSGDWQVLTTRLDDAGDQVVALLGMQPDQFTQVAMLPQGDFQKFLGARNDDRQAILQRLFSTDRFALVERWLRDRRLELSRALDGHRSGLHGLLSRFQEASGRPLPDAWTDESLAWLLKDGDVVGWCGQVATDLDREQVDTAERATRAGRAAAEAESRREEAVALDRLRREGQQARDHLADAAADAEASARWREQLDAHHRAQPVLALARQWQRAVADLERARAAAGIACAAASLEPDASPEGAEAHHRIAQRRLHALEEFLPRQEQLEHATLLREQHRDSLAEVDAMVIGLEARSAGFPDRRQDLEAQLLAARLAIREEPRLRQELAATETGLAAALRLVDVRRQVEEATRNLLVATDRHQELRERHQDLREARINAMAGELAAGLAAGCSCPVCGSESHPSPAVSEHVVSRDQEDEARTAVDDAAIVVETLRDRRHTLTHEIAALEETAGSQSVEAWRRRQADARGAHGSAVTTAAGLESLEQQRESLDADEEALSAELLAARRRHTALSTELDSLASAIETLEHDAHRLLADVPEETVTDAMTATSARVADLAGAVEALSALDAARHAEEDQAAAIRDESIEAGFESREAAAAAHLGESEADALRQRLEDHAERLAAARATLARTEVVAALAQEAPDLASIDTALTTAREANEEAITRQRVAADRSARVRRLVDLVDRAAADCRPVLDQHELVAGLAELVEGRSAHHDLRMRLSAYVLSERLGSVVAAANDHLVRMGLDRFTLEQSDAGGARDRRGGLGLRVRDAWTSTLRETGTLSGGETFMVSLALALGLSDTVTAESGGVHIETLFVDEGFGSLDSEALEGVMDSLDALREGGRAVGVVSHVTEMRERIGTQLRVTAGPSGGSTLAVCVDA